MNAQNQCDVFRCHKDATTNEFAFYSGKTGTTAPAAYTDRLYRLKMLENTTIDRQEDGTVKLTFANYDDSPGFEEDFLQVINPASAASSSDKPEVIFENKEKLNAASSTGDYQCVISYGIEYPGATAADNTIKMTVAIGTFAKTAGSTSQKYDEHTQPTLEFTSIIAPVEIDLPAALFDTTMLDATNIAAKLAVIENNKGYACKFIKVKS